MHLPTAPAPARRRHLPAPAPAAALWLPILQPRPPRQPHQLTRVRLLPAPSLRLLPAPSLRLRQPATRRQPALSLPLRQPAIRRRPTARPAAVPWRATTRQHRRLRRMPSPLAINLLPAAPAAVQARPIRMLLPALHPAALRLQPAVTRPPLLIRRPLRTARRAERTCRKPRRFSRCLDC